jgi:hypothetical protein
MVARAGINGPPPQPNYARVARRKRDTSNWQTFSTYLQHLRKFNMLALLPAQAGFRQFRHW